MKTLFCFLVFLSVAPCFSQAQNSTSVATFHWLLGTWERLDTKPGRQGFETWTQSSADELQGIGVSLKDGDTTFVEKLKLTSKDGKMYYVADVSHNAAPVYFEITEVSETGFVCENPAHDFPKKIEYSLVEGMLTAETSGNGKSSFFHFKKR